MKFRAGTQDSPEINLIPFIDVLLVILIFLMLTTTYSRFTELQVQLPVADAEQLENRPNEIVVLVSAEGAYAVNHDVLDSNAVDTLTAAIQSVAAATQNPVLIISADAQAPHQAVVTVMEAARRANVLHITFATQHSGA